MWRHNPHKQQPQNLLQDAEEKEAAKEPCSTELNISNFGSFLEVSKDKLTVRYTGNGAHTNDVGSIQGNRPVPRKQLLYYFEITVLDRGENCKIGVGFTDKNFKLGRQPGWEANSYGYHGDDGKKFNNMAHGQDYGPKFEAGDIIGAGLHLGKQEMFFTKNGKHLGLAFREIVTVPLYPTIGLHSKNERVTVNFGQHPFKFDLEGLVQEEVESQHRAVHSTPMPPGATHQIVRNYLMYYGYSNTLAAFDAAAGLIAGEEASTSSREREIGPEGLALDVRKQVRQLLMGGQVEAAKRVLCKHFPELLESRTRPDLDVYFYIQCAAFIELIRDKDIEGAVKFAQEVLAPLRGLLAHRSRGYEAMLHDVVALVAYEDPQESPLAGLLDPLQREAVADVINSAIIGAAAGKIQWESRPQPALERLLQQLVGVHEELHEANGGQGEPFRLQQHLLPPRSNGELRPPPPPPSPPR
ncbi:hypothetical protein WJX72_003712 [[Myrmecia] bisecta]|uniref:Ran-binding protein 10 n=1 Tax=[Myrmecia] bisecta TaxID=41462 RepID=A0AAW1PCZ1_9CHLO